MNKDKSKIRAILEPSTIFIIIILMRIMIVLRINIWSITIINSITVKNRCLVWIDWSLSIITLIVYLITISIRLIRLSRLILLKGLIRLIRLNWLIGLINLYFLSLIWNCWFTRKKLVDIIIDNYVFVFDWSSTERTNRFIF